MTYLPPATMLTQTSAIREWESLMRQIGQLAEQALDLAQGRTERIFVINQLDAVIAATGHGQIVGDSGYTREAALAARVFITWFVTGSQIPLLIDTLPDDTAIYLTPLQILSGRPAS